VAGQSQVFLIFVHVWDGPIVYTTPALAKLTGKWEVFCDKELPGGGQGCTPGFWKTHPEVWTIPTDSIFDTVFVRDAFNPDITMLDAVGLEGGHLMALSRHATAAYLNALSPFVDFDMTAGAVVATFQSAFDPGDYETTKEIFEGFNELGCPD
jgi:hypothetical protein